MCPLGSRVHPFDHWGITHVTYDSDNADSVSVNDVHTVEMEIETTLLFDHISQTTNHRPPTTRYTIPRMGYLILTSFRSWPWLSSLVQD